MPIKIKYKYNINCDDVDSDIMKTLMTDGRFASPLSENIISNILVDFSKTDETKGYDGYLNGARCEIKSITDGGLKTCPSYMIGYGRVYIKEEHANILNKNKYYIINDIVSESGWFNYYIVPSSDKLLFKQMSKTKAIKFLDEIVEDTITYNGTKISVNF